IRHCRVVRMANLAQLVNAIAPIFTSQQGLFLQTIYHPLRLYAEHMREVALDVSVDAPRHDLAAGLEERTFGRVHHVADLGPFSLLDAVATCDEGGRALTIGVVNRDRDRPHTATIDLGTAKAMREVLVSEVNGPDVNATNSFEHPSRVGVREHRRPATGHHLEYEFPAHSVSVLRVALASCSGLGPARAGVPAPRRRRALPRAAGPRVPGRPPADGHTTRGVRRGRGRPPARLDQRAGPGALPHALEPLRPLRPGSAGPARLPPPPPLRVLGARGVPRAGLSP